MAKHIGRLVNLGIGKESSRGTAVAATYWLPKTEVSLDNQIEQIVHNGSIGRIEESNDADIAETRAAGSVTGRIQDESIGLLLLSGLGTVASPSLVETGVYDHVFTVANNNTHQSLTLNMQDPNASGSSSLRMALSMIDQLQLQGSLRQYAMFTANFRGNASATGSETPSYSAQNYFVPKHLTLELAATQGALDDSGLTNVKSYSINIVKNLEDDYSLGSVAATERLNKQFTIEGSFELMYEDRTMIDTILMGDAYRAVRLRMVNDDVTIGSTENPMLQIDLHRVKFQEVARNISNDDYVTQTVNFKGHYSQTDSALVTATLRNTKSSQY